MRIVIEKVQPLTYKCFYLTFIKGQKVKNIAIDLGISPNLIAQHKHKVYNLIIKEAEKLNDKQL
jgi:DNA-binding CsgD family transcriptional regulator